MDTSSNSTQYEDALRAMHYLLATVNESHWANWINVDIGKWVKERDVSHHLSGYGGMGSFNDVVLCSVNDHTISKDVEPIANTIFRWLRSICSFLARQPDSFFSAETLKKNVGYRDSNLSAFVGGSKAPDSMRGLIGVSPNLEGLRCLSCEYSEISKSGILTFIASLLLPPMIFKSIEDRTLLATIRQALEMRIPQVSNFENAILSELSESKINLAKAEWNWNCPACGKKDTAVYRWELVSVKPFKFAPSNNNLKLRF